MVKFKKKGEDAPDLRTCCVDLDDEQFGVENITAVCRLSDALVPLSNQVFQMCLDGEAAIKRGIRDLKKFRPGNFWSVYLWAIKQGFWDLKKLPGDQKEALKVLHVKNRVSVFNVNPLYSQKHLDQLVEQGQIPSETGYVHVADGWRRGAIKNGLGSFDSYLAKARDTVARTKDWKAKPPRMRKLGRFYTLRCEPGGSIVDGRFLRVNFGTKHSDAIRIDLFSLSRQPYPQVKELMKVGTKGIKSITVSRRNWENSKQPAGDLRRKGFWRISVNYELPLPKEAAPITRLNTVYLVLDPDSPEWLGVLAPGKPFATWKLPQPHRYFFGKVKEIDEEIKARRGNLGMRTGGLSRARRGSYGVCSTQQTHNEYIDVRKLMGLGVHFVVLFGSINHPDGAANAKDPNKGGDLGYNRTVQSTGVNSLFIKLKQKLVPLRGKVKRYVGFLPDVSFCHNPIYRKRLLAEHMRKENEAGTAELEYL